VSLRLGALHDALLDPGNAEKAQRAAEEVASYETRFQKLESDLTLLKWMVGTNIVLTLAVLGRLLFIP
jgi:hypothetical protein